MRPAPDYVGITETPRDQITAEALSMAYSRYAWARSFAHGKDVLEIGCGAGQGLGYLAASARRVTGGDFSQTLLGMAREHYGSLIPLVRLDGQQLPFTSSSFDLVVLFEALYYLPNPAAFAAEAARLIRPGGTVLLSAVNPEWRDHLPSAFSHRYHTARDLQELLAGAGLEAEVLVGFPVPPTTMRGALISSLKRLAIKYQLIPSTMQGKRLLKRLFLGNLVNVWPQVQDGVAKLDEPRRLESNNAAPGFRVLYAAGRRR